MMHEKCDAWKCGKYPYNFAASYSNRINYAIKVKKVFKFIILFYLNDGQKARIYVLAYYGSVDRVKRDTIFKHGIF